MNLFIFYFFSSAIEKEIANLELTEGEELKRRMVRFLYLHLTSTGAMMNHILAKNRK